MSFRHIAFFPLFVVKIIGCDKLYILPHRHIGEFYKEYDDYCKERNIDTTKRGKRSTFGRALRLFGELNPETKLHFSRCKGHFQTCEVCNKADDLMKNTRMTEAQRNVYRQVKRLHLKQQLQERNCLDKNRQLCMEKDEQGQPKMALLFSDGMTIYTTNTPKLYKTNSKGGLTKKIESRIIGVEVVCGDIDTMFIYYTDNMVGGGSNILIEVQRQAIYGLQKLLAVRGQLLTQKILFQFDNCGENKVRRIEEACFCFIILSAHH